MTTYYILSTIYIYHIYLDAHAKLLFQSDPITSPLKSLEWFFHLTQRKSLHPYKGPQACML